MIEGVSKVVIEVDDQARALKFWTATLGFELDRYTDCGEESWVEVRTPDRALVLVLRPRRDVRTNPSAVPATSNVVFCCDHLGKSYDELRSRGVQFSQPPVELSFGWWSMFQDLEGNRFALHPRELGMKGADPPPGTAQRPIGGS